VNRDATADGIAAAPVLGRGLGGGGSVPILLVDDELPAAANDYLASTAEVNAAGNKTHLGVVAIGGTAVVSNSVMADAVAAAKTSSALTATITPLKYTAATLAAARATTDNTHPCRESVPASAAAGSYTCQFRVTYSDNVELPVDADDPADGIQEDERRGTVEDPTMYRINGRRLAASASGAAATTSDEPVSLLDLVFTADRTVTLTLTHHLEAGDTITVDNSLNEAADDKLGAKNDRRNLEAASLTLPGVTIAADRNAPVVEIVAVPGQTTFSVIVSEPSVLHSELATGDPGSSTPGSNWRDFVSVQGKGAARVATTFESADTDGPTKIAAIGRKTAHQRYTVTVDQTLNAGDVITIERKAILDRGGRGNPLTRHTVPKVKTNTPGPAGTGNLEIQSVSIGNVRHGDDAGGDHAMASLVDTADADVLTVKAKATGVASGARGNDWRIFGYDDRRDREASTDAFNIDVGVDIANQRISYTISDVLPRRSIDRQARISDLAAALVSNSDFAANFSVDYVRDATTGETEQSKGTELTATNPAGAPFSGGLSSVGVVVKFNAAVSALQDGAGAAEETGDTLASAIATRFPETDARTADVDTIAVTFQAPDNQVHISYQSDAVGALPARGGFRVIPAGIAAGYADTSASLPATQQVTEAVTNIREILNSLRPDASIKP